MPEGHWAGYVRYIESYSTSPAFVDFWGDVGCAFSRDFSSWMTEIVNRNNGMNLPYHDDALAATPQIRPILESPPIQEDAACCEQD